MPLLVVELRHLSGFSPQGVRAFDAHMTRLRPQKLQISIRAEPRLWARRRHTVGGVAERR